MEKNYGRYGDISEQWMYVDDFLDVSIAMFSL